MAGRASLIIQYLVAEHGLPGVLEQLARYCDHQMVLLGPNASARDVSLTERWQLRAWRIRRLAAHVDLKGPP